MLLSSLRNSDNHAALRTTPKMTTTCHSPVRRNPLLRMFLPAFAMLLAGSALAQQPVPATSTPANDAPELKLDAPDKKLFLSTTRIEAISTDGKRDSVGTGFVFLYNPVNQRDVLFLVTCRHVVDGFASATLSFAQRKNGQPDISEICRVTVPNLPEQVFYDPDPKIDVALLPLRPLLPLAYTGGPIPFFQTLSPDLIPNRAAAERLNAIQAVTFLGYPEGVRDEKSPLPVARHGVTASPYVVDYASLPAFLIDADIAPGSSGSPVVVLDQDSQPPQTATIPGGVRFVGMLSDAYFQTVNGTPKFHPPPSASGAMGQSSTNLAAVIKPQAILNTISEYVKIHPLAVPDDSDRPSKN